MKELEIAHKI